MESIDNGFDKTYSYGTAVIAPWKRQVASDVCLSSYLQCLYVNYVWACFNKGSKRL